MKSLPIEGWQHVCARRQDGNRSDPAAMQGWDGSKAKRTLHSDEKQTPMNLDSSSHYMDVSQVIADLCDSTVKTSSHTRFSFRLRLPSSSSPPERPLPVCDQRQLEDQHSGRVQRSRDEAAVPPLGRHLGEL